MQLTVHRREYTTNCYQLLSTIHSMNTFILGVETFPYYPLPSIPKVGLAYLRLKIFIGTSEILVLFCLSSNFY